ncbi:cell wall metabolism sensor histidine kinase WalK [Streptomyces luteolifulvus]|nr:cell wall metabolism sensor histidine kinase WalK [Streptomyces luteolifulvus]
MSGADHRCYRTDAARNRSEGGGLGTAIARENARLHDDTIGSGSAGASV